MEGLALRGLLTLCLLTLGIRLLDRPKAGCRTHANLAESGSHLAHIASYGLILIVMRNA